MEPAPSRSVIAGAPSRGRRRVFVLVYAAFLFVLAEGGAFLGLSWLEGGRASADGIRTRMMRVCELDDGPADEAGQAEQADANARRIVHPYLGYLMRSWTREREDLARLEMPALYEPDSPIFDDDPDTVVLGVSGGSVAAAFSSLGGIRRLAERLGEHPRFAGKRFRLVSLSAGGWKQPQQLMALSYVLALGGRVDLLVDLAGFNEIALHELENQGQGVAPIYPRSWSFISQQYAVRSEFEELEDLHRERVRAARAALRSPLRGLWTRRLWWTWNDARLARAERALQDELRGRRHEVRERSPSDLIALGPRIRGETRSERLDELVRIWSDCALQMDLLCKANGIAFFACLQPNQYVPDSKPLSADELAVAIDTDPGLYQPLVLEGYPRLRAAGTRLRAERGLEFVDLTTVFENVDETVYVDDCCHVNELGNARMAEEIARAILASIP